MERAAHSYARNCRQCHGNEGEGRIGPALNPAFRANNPNLRDYTDEASRTENQQIVLNTLQCGRIGTIMPPWAQDQGGGLIDEQIRQLMLLMVNPTAKAWDHVAEISAEEEATVPLPPLEEVLSGAAVTGATSYVCGQRAPEQPEETGPVEFRQQWTLVATDNRFDVRRMGVAANQSATVTLQNRGNALHNWVVQNVRGTNGQAVETALIPGGQTATVTFTIATPGTYPFLCTLHPTEMRGSLVVQ
jgi:plastocyanin